MIFKSHLPLFLENTARLNLLITKFTYMT